MHIVYIQYTFCKVLNEVPTVMMEWNADDDFVTDFIFNPQIALIFTDGIQSTSGSYTPLDQASAPLKAKGVRIFSFGIGGGTDYEQLKKMATNSTTDVFYARSFRVLELKIATIVDNLCPPGMSFFKQLHTEQTHTLTHTHIHTTHIRARAHAHTEQTHTHTHTHTRSHTLHATGLEMSLLLFFTSSRCSRERSPNLRPVSPI